MSAARAQSRVSLADPLLSRNVAGTVRAYVALCEADAGSAPGDPLSGTLKADNTGVASCAKTSGGTQVGFEYFWTTGAIDVFDSKGCSERGF